MRIRRIWDAVTFGPARRRREMNRRLATMDFGDLPGFPTSSRNSRRRRRSRGSAAPSSNASPFRLVAVLLVIGALVVGMVVLLRRLNPAAQTAAPPTAEPTTDGSGSAAGGGGGTDSRFPPPGVEAGPTRLRPVVAAPAGSGGYTFTGRNPDGTPLTYDPCRPIHYVVRDRNTPPGGDQVVSEAVNAVSAATGLVFVYDGRTTEAPSGS